MLDTGYSYSSSQRSNIILLLNEYLTAVTSSVALEHTFSYFRTTFSKSNMFMFSVEDTWEIGQVKSNKIMLEKHEKYDRNLGLLVTKLS